MRTLSPAARGYEYQDLYSACALVDLVLGGLLQVTVDRKLTPDDRFDDITTVANGLRRNRVQIKHTDEDRALPGTTFTTEERSLRLDRLLAAARADRDGPGASATDTIYRVVLRDGPPTDPVLTAVLRRADPDPGALVPGAVSERFRFDAEALWAGVHQPASGRREAGNAYGFLHGGPDEDRDRADLEWLCDHLVVEVGAPAMSGDLLRPGPLERVLLDRVVLDIGAGRFPNGHRAPVDVATALVGLVRAVRQGLAEASTEEVLRRTQLRRDFGAVARVRVVDPEFLVDRPETVGVLADLAGEVAGEGGCLLCVGAPGQGKSWVAEQLNEELVNRGWLVADHYCFVGDADGDRLPRVMAESVFGTLLDRVAEVDPEAVREQRPRFAADEEALLGALARARGGAPDRRIALVVDGLDHVTRVRGAVIGAHDPSTILAEALSGIELPAGCVLVVLSQPGVHLAPLEAAGARRTVVPSLRLFEVEALAARHGLVSSSNERVTDTSGEPVDGRFLDVLAERSGGNALYATYLCREVARAPDLTDAAAVVAALPAYDGTLHAYYDHLHASLGEGDWVADVIALLDAPVTASDLGEILPYAAHRVGPALEVLAPVLEVRTASGAVRIYHESFARYLREAFQGHPDALVARLCSLADWLERRGLFTDDRAFRHLLGMLNDAGRPDRVLELVDRDFVVDAVGAGFPMRLVRSNLAAGVRAAASTGDWRAATRCVELARAAATFELERFESTMVDFIDVAAAVVGAQQLADRLLDDDRPAVPARAGLVMCAALDAMGVVVPWQEYLEAFGREQDDHIAYDNESNWGVQEAILRGRLRLKPTTLLGDRGDGDRLPEPVDLDLVAEWLNDNSVRCGPTVRAVLDTCGLDAVLELGDACLTPGHVLLALAEELIDRSGVPADVPAAREWAITAARHGVGNGQAHRLLRLGAPIDLLVDDPAAERVRLLDLTRAVQTTGQDDTQNRWRADCVPEWLDRVVTAARLDPVGLAAAEALVGGEGWYPCFLRCAIAVASAEAAPARERSLRAIEALKLLMDDTRPFVGSPRACDLYPVAQSVKLTVRRAVDLLDAADWEQGVRLVVEVGDAVNTTLRGEMGGPLPRDWLLDMVVATAPNDALEAAGRIVIREIEEGSGGRFYADLAEYRLFACRIALRGGDSSELARRWREACWLLTGYGFHKDITVYDLLEPLSRLTEADPARARLRVARVQGLCERLPMHTDGRETRWAPARWWASLAEADPVAAVDLAAAQMFEAVNEDHGRLRSAVHHVWERWSPDVDPLVAASLRLAIDPPLTDVDEATLVRLAGSGDSTTRREVARLLVARADERSVSHSVSNNNELVARDNELARAVNRGASAAMVDEVGIDTAALPPGRSPTDLASDEGSLRDRIDRLHGLTDPPVLPGAAGIARALVSWRQHGLHRDTSDHLDRYANLVGYRLVEMLQAGHDADAASALRRIVTLVDFGPGTELMGAVADGLKRLDWENLATLAYALHWTRTRADGGWLTFGGESELDSLREARRLDPVAARGVVMQELELLVGGSPAYGLNGVTEALVLAGVHGALDADGLDVALGIWDEALAVIESRAPRMAPSDDPDRPYYAPTVDPGESVVGDLDLAFAVAAVSGVASPERAAKRRALVATRLLLAHRPALAGTAIAQALRQLDDPGHLGWLLALIKAAGAPAEVINACRRELVELCGGIHLSVRVLARGLLPPDERPGLGPSDPALLSAKPSLWVPTMTAARPPVNMDRAVELQAGDRLRSVESALPGLSGMVVRVASARLASRVERLWAQVRRLGMTSTHDEWPDGLTVVEQTIESVLQELAAGARGLALVTGEPPQDPEAWEQSLGESLLDDPTLALDIEATRYPRPALPFPGSGADSPTVVSVRVLPDEVWPVVAAFERHHPRPDRYHATTDAVRVQGLELVVGLGSATIGDLPLEPGRLSAWFGPGLPGGAKNAVDDRPLFGVSFDSGPTAARMGLGLPPALITPTTWLVNSLGLRPGRRYVMWDEHGPALAMMTWRAHYLLSDYHLPYPTLVGSAAALRPDLLDALHKHPDFAVRSRVVEEVVDPEV